MPVSRTQRRRANPAPPSPYLTDPLLRELIPQRITPAPGTHDGPTAQWRRVEAARALWAGEFEVPAQCEAETSEAVS